MDIFRHIESQVFELNFNEIKGDVMEISEAKLTIDLPIERPLYSPTQKQVLIAIRGEEGNEQLNRTGLLHKTKVDKTELIQHIRQLLQHQPQITLQNIIEKRLLKYGLSELVSYL